MKLFVRNTNPKAGDPFTLCLMNGPLGTVLPLSHIAFVYSLDSFCFWFQGQPPHINTHVRRENRVLPRSGNRRKENPSAGGCFGRFQYVAERRTRTQPSTCRGECSKPPVKPARASGGIGRRAGFRFRSRKRWRFESSLAYQFLTKTKNSQFPFKLSYPQLVLQMLSHLSECRAVGWQIVIKPELTRSVIHPHHIIRSTPFS